MVRKATKEAEPVVTAQGVAPQLERHGPPRVRPPLGLLLELGVERQLAGGPGLQGPC